MVPVPVLVPVLLVLMLVVQTSAAIATGNSGKQSGVTKSFFTGLPVVAT